MLGDGHGLFSTKTSIKFGSLESRADFKMGDRSSGFLTATPCTPMDLASMQKSRTGPSSSIPSCFSSRG